MVRRRPVVILAALALLVGGCASAHANPAQQVKAHVATQSPSPSDDGTPDPAPSTAGSPSAGSPSAAGTPSGPAGPKAPTTPTQSGTTIEAGHHGPFGALTTTGTDAVALTFDDGPFPYTSQVLDLLAQYHIKATFCVIGRQVAANAALIRRIVAEGHTLCNHTWSHDLSLRLRSPDQIRAEMQRTNDAIHAVVPDAPIKYFREPGGNWGANTVSMATSLGMTSIHWAVDPTDWMRPAPQVIVNRVLSHTGPGSIVLMHDGGGVRDNTVVALRTILPTLAGRYTLIALPTA